MANFNFDEIKRNASGVADRAVKKTGEMTNIVKLKVAVKTAETKLNSVYEEIGRLFYTAERNGEDCTADIAAYIMKADKLKADIASYNKDIAKLRNVRICDSCGNEIDENVNFCPVCGAKQEVLVEVDPNPDIEEIIEVTVEEDAPDAFDEAKDKAEEFFANIADSVSEKAEEIKEGAEDLAEKVEDAADDAVDKIDEVIDEIKDEND